jgi:ribosomal protein L7/L12
MAQVVIDGWRAGVMTVSCIQLLHQTTDLSLKAAKDAIEAVLDGTAQRIEVPSSETASALAAELRKLGARAHVSTAA